MSLWLQQFARIHKSAQAFKENIEHHEHNQQRFKVEPIEIRSCHGNSSVMLLTLQLPYIQEFVLESFYEQFWHLEVTQTLYTLGQEMLSYRNKP